MAKITQIRGALLEEAVLFLLNKVGYEAYDPKNLLPLHGTHLRAGHSGLEVRGRGTWHQIDAFALWKHSPAFMYPLHLVVEAKCYAPNRPVGVEVIRNCVGVLKDISENYFTYFGETGEFQGPRYNYSAAIFSTSGYTRGAVEYAVAHQVFLIQYENIPAIKPLIESIFSFDESAIALHGKSAISAARQYFRNCLSADEGKDVTAKPAELTVYGAELLRGQIAPACREIRGSYFGMLQGRWPLHLLRRDPLPSKAFSNDIIRCRVHGDQVNGWRFVPINTAENNEDWFELEFSLPTQTAQLVEKNWRDPVTIANLKQRYFSYIDLGGIIGGVRRNVRLELDNDWLNEYIRSQS